MASRPDYFEKLDSLEIANYTKSKLNFFPYVSSNQNSITKFEDNKIGAEIFITLELASKLTQHLIQTLDKLKAMML